MRNLILAALLAGGGLLAACSSDSTGSPTSTGETSAGGGTASGGAGGTADPGVNGCTDANTEDHTGESNVDVAFGGTLGSAYDPPCIRVDAGTTVTFNGDFVSHPISGGVVDGTTLSPDPSSPIAQTSTGMTATFSFDDPGTFPYFCQVHGPFGMTGAVFVE